ncbi:ABC-2 type transporter [Paludibacter propionicigenes WB4]|uniref:ABC-2 type transporter n=1 Tax=Paludibacter propionicigenes (strain DSM 17365 / JCM 13257 / WB4) TaxID=694427 RepID=E4T2U3_PALPW|nr:ABC transporter permease [Paludibacter propionicigenes]ADQ79037.1 ABC-2 type transporter [Paludibacter propionicigenes WB4]
MSNNTVTAFKNTLNRELKRMVSRPIYFISTFVIMTFCYVFFLTFFNEGQPNKMPIGIVDLDNSSISRQFVRNLEATQQAKIVMRLNSHKEAREEMQRGNIYAFVEIKRNFANDAITNRRPTLTFYINDAYLIAGSLISKDITYMSAATSIGMQQKVLRAKGIDESRIKGIIQPIALDTHLIGNPWANYGTYLLNVILPGMLQLMVLLMTAFPIGVEYKQRTSREWVENANHSMFAALTGKLLPYTVIFTFLGIIGNILLYKYMHYPLNSSIGWMFLATFLLVISSQAVGVIFIGITPVLRDGVTFAGIFGTLGITFAGSTFPIEQMPMGSRIISELFPIHHYFNIYVDQALNGIDIHYSLISYVFMLAFLILPFFVFNRLKNAAISQNYPTK